MKIGIISDSHENMDMIARAVEVFNTTGTALVFHAGDIISPITFKEFKKLNCPLIGVFGNNDGEKDLLRERFKGKGEFYKVNYEGEHGGMKIILMHEPRQIGALAASQQYDLIIYGHTHVQEVRTIGRTLIINPGESGGWLEGMNTVAVVELPEKAVTMHNLRKD